MYVENYFKEKSRKEKVKNKIMILKAFRTELGNSLKL